MDAAYLHNSVFNIDMKRKELEEQGLNRKEVVQWCEENFRVFSKKSAFICLCCNKPVNMNLTKDEGRPFYFRHNDESECFYSENTKKYQKQVTKLENKKKKDIGLTIFQEILEGELKPHGVEIERGYLYKKKLDFIPDFIIKFPESEERWAIDYFTAINQGLTSGSYASYLSKRMETYKEEDFIPFSFVDHSWLSYREETNKGTLLRAETQVSNKSHEDEQWDLFLEENVQKELLEFLINDSEASIRKFDTRNIAYVNTSSRLCEIFRYIPISTNDRNITFYKLSSSQIPLSQALAVNVERNHFALSVENEDDKRKDFLNSLIEKKKQHKLEQKQLKEEQERIKEQRKVLQNVPVWTEGKNVQEYGIEILDLEYELNERQMQRTARKAAARPIEVDPNGWNEPSYWKTQQNYTYQRSIAVPAAKKEDGITNEKREKVRDLLLTTPISSEGYIGGKQMQWRKAILKWIKENQMGDSLNVSLQKIIHYLKSEGISFNQNEKLIKYPITNFLEYYVKIVKKELKKKIDLKIVN